MDARLSVLIIALCLLNMSDGWLFRRRRRSCGAVSCVWNNWGAWGACTHPCGSAGTKTRTRSVQRQAACGGAGCSGSSSQSVACNRFCRNGGIPKPGYCSCSDTFWGKCCEYACARISSCELLHCTSGTNQQCKKCSYDRGTIKAFRLISSGGRPNRVCQKICSWRPDSRFCFPGKCASIPTSCNCAPGFSSPGSNCMTIYSNPTVSHCLSTVQSASESIDIVCTSSSSTKYTKLRINRVKIDWRGQFIGPNARTYPKPAYIPEFKVGVTAAAVTWTVNRGPAVIGRGSISCNSVVSRDRPNQGMYSCKGQSNVNVNYVTGDTLEISSSITNGGYVKVRNYDRASGYTLYPTKYYSGRTVSRRSIFKLDFEPPEHCTTSPACISGMLNIGSPFTKNGKITVRWNSWTDGLSGIAEYDLQVYKLISHGSYLDYTTQAPVFETKLEPASSSATFQLTQSGVYCVMMAVEDKAGNFQRARKFLMFDNNSTVTVNQAQKIQVLPSSSNGWINQLRYIRKPTANVTVKWTGHFENRLHHNGKLLNAIKKYAVPLSPGYEEITGQPPSTRSMQAIPNTNGIVKFQLFHAVDKPGGGIIAATPVRGKPVQYIKAEEGSVAVSLTDGDSLRVWIRAFDVMGNRATDSVLLHVDTSPPVISNMGLSRHGQKQLAVHHSRDLFDMEFTFDVHDYQSGVKEIRWELHDKEDSTRVHGSDHIAAVKLNKGCSALQCYCIEKDRLCFQKHYMFKLDSSMNIPHGKHEYDYYFVITAKNNALLNSTVKFQITVDISGPEAGAVKDNLPGQPDVDYQQSRRIHASWQNFFDKESGVVFYQYAFATHCFNATAFSTPVKPPVKETKAAFASYNSPRIGKYFATVVAYNAALEPSVPVCSDGVTIDSSAPFIARVNIANVFTRDGLATDKKGKIWYIRRDRTRILLTNTTASCRREAGSRQQLTLYPVATNVSKSSIPSCQRHKRVENRFFMSEENKLELSWYGSDPESGVFDYQVAVSSSGIVPDILPFSSTSSHTHFITYHPNLADRSIFFVIIRAINRAGLERQSVIGPITVIASPPEFNGKLEVSHNVSSSKEFLVAKWKINSYSASELSSGLIYRHYYSIGYTPYGEELQYFKTISNSTKLPGLCTWNSLPLCVVVSVDQLDWKIHASHIYYISLKIESIGGLNIVVTSEPFRHIYGPPRPGIVMEVPLDIPVEQATYDIDHQTNKTVVRILLRGFTHVNLAIKFAVGVGTKPQIDDITPFRNISTSNDIYTLRGLTLRNYKKYYVSVKAFNEEGTVIVSSDGITILPTDISLSINILDGAPCAIQNQTKGMNHHQGDSPSTCQNNIDAQASRTTLQAHWTFPEYMDTIITSVKWVVEKRMQQQRSVVWLREGILKYDNLLTYVSTSDLHLTGGSTYRFAVQFCYTDGCFNESVSDGVLIMPEPPIPKPIENIIIDDSGAQTQLSFMWYAFVDPFNTKNAIKYYEWTMLVKHSSQTEQLFQWNTIEHKDISITGNTLLYKTSLSGKLEYSSCLALVIRGYNLGGLHASSSRNIAGCSIINNQSLIVLDAVGKWSAKTGHISNITLQKNAKWTEMDKEYTPSDQIISAVWPNLRHGKYAWKVVSDSGIQRLAYFRPSREVSYAHYQCASSAVLSCGQTQDNFVNIRNIKLTHGTRYYVCIHANQTEQHFEKFTQTLPEVMACSNGVVADLTPPDAGHVWIGNQNGHVPFQVERHQMSIYWESFRDVEEKGNTAHHSGVQSYQYAIGQTRGAHDVYSFTDVGLTNMAVLRNLLLQEGHTYYVTVKAQDYVGRSTVAYSPGVTIDASPPNVTDVKIDVGGPYTTERKLDISWVGVFQDRDSGITKYSWCLGSRPALCDIVKPRETNEEKGNFNIATEGSIQYGYEYFITNQGNDGIGVNPLGRNKSLGAIQELNVTGLYTSVTTLLHPVDIPLQNGHECYATVQAINGAGLSTTATSWGVTVDTTAPTAGEVRETNGPNSTMDIDFQVNTNQLDLHWEGFHDPHTPIVNYIVSVGKCAGCQDVLERSSLGLLTGLTVQHLALAPGHIYYTTVEACNAANLCTTVTSDGVIPDSSRPTAGLVLDGSSGRDAQFQSHSRIISAHWYNFDDVHSGLSYYEWRMGTTKGGDDILHATRLHVTNRATTNLSHALVTNKTYYITVRAYNKAGLWAESSSDGFQVDGTPPVVVQTVRLDESMGSIRSNTQVWKSSLSIAWAMKEAESFIWEQYLSVMTRDLVHVNIPTIKVHGEAKQYTFTNISLIDGETYYVKVIACNAARLCTTSNSSAILVDTSPPSSGAFAIATEHAIDLERHRDSWMTYKGTTVKLAWLGFDDPHSGIHGYHVTIGRSYGGTELLNVDSVHVQHSVIDQHRDEGFVQTAAVTIKQQLNRRDKIFVSVWAENKVGLLSEKLHGTFTAIPASGSVGTLSLIRRCDPISCEGHCTCAPQSQHHCDGQAGTCHDVTGMAGYQSLQVFDKVDYRTSAASKKTDVNYTRSQCALSANWVVNPSGQHAPIRYEWSVGMKGSDPGRGLLDLQNDNVWTDSGHKHQAVFTTSSSSVTDVELSPLVEYQFHVKAWYDASKFAIYRSNGIKTDSNGPELSKSGKVKEVKHITSNQDVDFIPSRTTISVVWANVFIDSHSDIQTFTVAIGTYDGNDAVFTKEYNKDTTAATLHGLNFKENTRYVTSVTAFNRAGLWNIKYSDGFTLDLTPPSIGTVHDENDIYDVDFTSEDRKVSASWHGFTDSVSFIHHYIWCVGFSPGGHDVIECQDVGLRLSSSSDVSAHLIRGKKVYSTVNAVDGAGHESAPGLSDGITVDTTPPQQAAIQSFGNNLVTNPSFEVTNTSTNIPSGWHVDGAVAIVRQSNTQAHDGNALLHVVEGSINQSISTMKLKKYRLTFYVSYPYKRHTLDQTVGFVSLPGIYEAFLLKPKSGFIQTVKDKYTSEEWEKQTFFVTATESTSNISFAAYSGKEGFYLDNIAVEQVVTGPHGQSYPNPVHVSMHTRGQYSTVAASWEVFDAESPITQYRWAIGYVKGGTQVQNFVSVGVRSHARRDMLRLPHGSSVHVTVIAYNAAGLSSAAHSEPIGVDLSTPDLCCVTVIDRGNSTNILTSTTVQGKWTVKDIGSGIHTCEWAIGQNRGSQDVMPFTKTSSTSEAEFDLAERAVHGEMYYLTVRCRNKLGLESVAYSDGIRMVLRPPEIIRSSLWVITRSPSHYATRDSHQSDNRTVDIGWSKIAEEAGVDHMEVKVEADDGTMLLNWRILARTGEKFASITDLDLKSHSAYLVNLRVVNAVMMISNPLSANFTVETSQPIASDRELVYTWLQGTELQLDWTDIFTSYSSMVFEVNVGTSLGGGDVLSWTETENTSMRINGVDISKINYVTITAINKAGLYTSKPYVVTYRTT